MFRKLFINSSIFVLVGFFAVFVFAKNSRAQITCNPTVRVDQFACTYNLLTGVCDHAEYNPNFVAVCNVNNNPTCQTAYGICSSNDSCTQNGTSCTCSSSVAYCGVASSSNPTPPPGGSGSCTTGDPFTGISNCGDVGRDPGAGSCGDGCLCCKVKSAPSFTGCKFMSATPSTVNVTVGSTVSTITQFYGYSGSPVTWGSYEIRSLSPAIATAGRVGSASLCCDIAYGYLPNTHGIRVTGVVPGNTTVVAKVTISDGQTCEGYIPVKVSIPVPQCEKPTVTAVPQCALTPGGNAQVTFQWNYVTDADYYDFYVVDTGTGNTISGTDTGFQPANSSTFNFCNGVGTTCTHVANIPEGTANYEARVISRSFAGTCSDSDPSSSAGFSVSLCPADAWWQTSDGDIITQGGVISSIPSTIVTPENNIALDGNGGYPGILMYGSGSAIDSGTGTVSTKNWQVQTSYLSRVPSFQDFVDLIPASVTPTDPASGGTSVSGSAFTSGGATDSNGYTWYRHNGDLNITSDVNLSGSRQVILYVQGNLTFSGRVNVDPKNQFFMAIVGKNGGAGGDINVSPTVTDSGTTKALTGIYYCEGHFRTGTTGTSTDGKLSVLGSVAALQGVNLERDLGTVGNITDPSEVFGISLDLFLKYPTALTFKRPIWQEVAP